MADLRDYMRRCRRHAAAVRTNSELSRFWRLTLALSYLSTPFAGFRRKLLGCHTPSAKARWDTEIADLLAGLVEADRLEGKPEREVQAHLRERVQDKLRTLRRRCKGGDWSKLAPAHVVQNIEKLSLMLHFTPVEQLVLLFLIHLHHDADLYHLTSTLYPNVDSNLGNRIVATTLGLPHEDVEKALSSSSRLMQSHLVKRDRRADRLPEVFEIVSPSFVSAAFSNDFDPVRAMRDRVVAAPAPTVPWKKFAHLGEMRLITHAYVSHALETGRKGVNILLHGEPGVGKSEFVRALAAHVGGKLFEVSTEDSDGDPIGPIARLQALRVIQSFCATQKNLIVFDEIEDVFTRFQSASDDGRSVRKGWINRTLENNAVVTFWLSNSVAAMDPAFIRRFDLCWEVKSPPHAVRKDQIQELPIELEARTVEKMAQCVELPIGVMARAAAVISAIRDSLGETAPSHAMELLVDQTLKAQQRPNLRPVNLPLRTYSLDFINADCDMSRIAEGISQARSARLCIYGPPGTGKTAFGQWLARSLGKPCLVQRASDLLGPFVGQSEQSIASAFANAREQGAVLLIDEVDSFLQERSGAQRSWEVTLVNEFLTQVENFDGVFVATTNCMGRLDAAAMRRFDLKAKFDYLRADQAARLLACHVSQAQLAAPTALESARLARLVCLTPGDFGAVERQSRFRPLRSVMEWIDALDAEVRQKPGISRGQLGFSSPG